MGASSSTSRTEGTTLPSPMDMIDLPTMRPAAPMASRSAPRRGAGACGIPPAAVTGRSLGAGFSVLTRSWSRSPGRTSARTPARHSTTDAGAADAGRRGRAGAGRPRAARARRRRGRRIRSARAGRRRGRAPQRSIQSASSAREVGGAEQPDEPRRPATARCGSGRDDEPPAAGAQGAGRSGDAVDAQASHGGDRRAGGRAGGAPGAPEHARVRDGGRAPSPSCQPVVTPRGAARSRGSSTASPRPATGVPCARRRGRGGRPRRRDRACR